MFLTQSAPSCQGVSNRTYDLGQPSDDGNGFRRPGPCGWRPALKQVAYDSEIRYLENRRVRVFVHGNDHFGRGHPGDVLDSARDAESQVEVGRDGLPRLADLVLVADPVGVHGRPGCPYGRARNER